MKKSLLEIYALAVCFFAAATLLIVGGQAAWNVVQLSAPELTLNAHDWSRHQTDEAYAESLERCCSSKDEKPKVPVGAELTAAREKSFALELKQHRRMALQDLMEHIVVIGIASLAFFIHWRIANKARQSAG